MESMMNPFEVLNQKLDTVLSELRKQVKPQQGTNGKEWGNVDFACKVTGYKPATIYLKVHKGEIPHTKRDGKLWFERTALLKWIETGVIQDIEKGSK